MRVGALLSRNGPRFRPVRSSVLGGGSNMDLAQLDATRLHTARTARLRSARQDSGPISTDLRPDHRGTGSEAAHGITDTENQIKVAFLSNYLRPTVAVVDPLLDRVLPSEGHRGPSHRRLTARLEAYTAVR